MTKFAIACAAAAMLLSAPSFSAPAAAAPLASTNMQMAQVNVRIGAPGVRREVVRHDMRRAERCVTSVSYRHGRKVVTKRCR